MEWAVNTSMTLTDHVSATFRRMANGADHFGDEADNAFRRASKSSSRFGDIVKGVLTAGAIEQGIQAVGRLASETVTVAREADAMATAYESVFGGEAGSQMQFVRRESERLGTAFKESADSYMQIAAAAKGTAISNETVQETFRGVSEAAAALQLEGDKVEGALTAISQMISKGKVSAEELRSQLGERIPGAFQIAARAMDMTTSELGKTMSAGKLMAEDFLPAFSKQLRKEFGAGAEAASNSFGAMNQKFDNSMRAMKVSLGKLLIPALTQLITEIRPVIAAVTKWASANREVISTKISNFISQATSVAQALWPVIQTVGYMIWGIWKAIVFLKPVLSTIIGLFIAYKAVMFGLMIISTVAKLINFLSTSFVALKTVTWLLNVALLANPLFWIPAIIIAVIAATAALIYWWEDLTAAAWNAFAAFDKLGTGLKVLLGIMFPLFGIGYLIWKNWDLITGAVNNAFKAFDKLSTPLKVALSVMFPMLGVAYLLWKYWDNIVGSIKRFFEISEDVEPPAGSGDSMSAAKDAVGGATKKTGGNSQAGAPGGFSMPDMPSAPQISGVTPESQTQKKKLEFYGRIDVFGLPEDSEFTRTGGNAPDIDVNLLGANK